MINTAKWYKGNALPSVRVVFSGEGHGHGVEPGAETDIEALPKGRVVEIGPPKTPSGWDCGTDVVFPILSEDYMREFHGYEYRRGQLLYCCRHQIVAGD